MEKEHPLDVLIEHQKKKFLEVGSKINPSVTHDDLLQPNDFTELENDPIVRYEEGILHGIQAAKAFLLHRK